MLMLILALSAFADDAAIKAERWARKAKPIAACDSEAECRQKWDRAKEWVRSNSRYQVAVDRPALFATYGEVYANTDLSFVVELRPNAAGGSEIAARAWCGNIITCKPKPKNALAALRRAIEGG